MQLIFDRRPFWHKKKFEETFEAKPCSKRWSQSTLTFWKLKGGAMKKSCLFQRGLRRCAIILDIPCSICFCHFLFIFAIQYFLICSFPQYCTTTTFQISFWQLWLNHFLLWVNCIALWLNSSLNTLLIHSFIHKTPEILEYNFIACFITVFNCDCGHYTENINYSWINLVMLCLSCITSSQTPSQILLKVIWSIGFHKEKWNCSLCYEFKKYLFTV